MIKIEITLEKGETLTSVLAQLKIPGPSLLAAWPTPVRDEPEAGQAPGSSAAEIITERLRETIVEPAVVIPTRTVDVVVETKEVAVTVDIEPLGPMDGDRKRGEAGAGHRRRTNAQIAEDDRYFAAQKARADAALAEADKGVVFEAPTEPLAISTGEERIDPQDAADEAKESAAAHPEGATLDDLRRAVGEYQKKHGMAMAQRRVPEIIGCPIIEVAAPEITGAIAKVRAAMESDHLEQAKFTPVDTSKPVEEVLASKADVQEAIKAYARKYDGTAVPAKMNHTGADIPRILAKLFGPNVTMPSAIPVTPLNYGKALTAINAELTKSSFGRSAK